MKKALILLTSLAVIQSAQAALVFYEPFAAGTYTNGALLGTGVGQWNRGASPAAGCSIVTNAAALTYSGLVTSNSSHGLLRPANSASANRHAGADLSPSQTISAGNPTVYCSFLLRVQAPPSGNRCVLGLSTTTSSNPTVGAGVWVNSGSRLLVSKNSTTPDAAATSALASGTHLVVMRYKYNASSSDDEVALWVNPHASTFGTNEANVPPFAIATTGNSDVTSFPAVYAVQGQGTGGGGTVWGSGSGTLHMDEIRVGTTWADVTPYDPNAPVEPPAPGTNGAPVITQTFMTPAGLALLGTNAPTNGAIQVLATTDIATPANQWDSLNTFPSDANGHFNCTNPVSSEVEQLFLRVVTVDGAMPTAPQITGEPQNQNLIVGQNASFSVVATGSQLSYQWYFNTNTLLNGKASSTLLINSVQLSDQGGYSVVVSNNLGSVTSIVASLTVASAPTNGTYYVATNGSDSNPGSIDAPFATLPKAISVVLPGETIYVRGGSHFYSQTIRVEKSGTPGNRITIAAFPGEQPLLDFVNQPYGSSNRGILFTTNGNHWNVIGLEIARAGDNGVKVEGSYIRFELCVFHHNGDSGLQIGFGHPAVNNINLAAFIDVINCDSYSNYDPDSNGGDADGFAAKLHCGQGIAFYGCRAWENSDDGWDLFETDASIIISNCWTWKSGIGQGNGNGFKLGGDGAGGQSKGTHYVYNSVAFGHKVNGFTQNSHRDGLVVMNCLSFTNGPSGYNYFMEGTLNSGKQNIFKNNVGIKRNASSSGNNFIADNNPVEQNNSWNLAVTANHSDYMSLLEAAAKAPRQPDGSLPTGFARLLSGSDLIDKGVDVGIPFFGAAPDLGPYEYAP
ncbi:MAG TPA: immunoglobulin domain-containing protein [Verrucomicrobiota bacterium]|nr:immunoglobulin domain-containing protein [Verrucomicrobiota bacterium]